MERPYRSPLGLPGAWVGFIISLIALAATVALEDNRPGVVGTGIFVGAMFAYYWSLVSRHRLVARTRPRRRSPLVREAEAEIV